MFRDHKIAEENRKIAALTDRLEEMRKRAEAAEAKVAHAEKPSVFDQISSSWSRWRAERMDRKMKALQLKAALSHNRGWYARTNPGLFGMIRQNPPMVLVGLFIVFIVFIIAMWIHHEFYDINEGVVTGGDYHPARTQCSTDSNGHTSCTTTLEYYTVDIAYQGEYATWRVSEMEYRRLQIGDWYCYQDLIRSECHGPPHSSHHTHADLDEK